LYQANEKRFSFTSRPTLRGEFREDNMTAQTFQFNQAVKSTQYGIGVVIAIHNDGSFRVEFCSGKRPVYWQKDGSEYNPSNERDYVAPFVSNYVPQ